MDRSLHSSECYCCEVYKLKDKCGHIVKSHLSPRLLQQNCQGLSATDDEGEDPLPIAYTSPEFASVHADVDICTAESVKEANKQITIIDLLKPILKNTEEQPMTTDTE